MNNKVNLDDLLKEELSNLQADAPSDIWHNLNSQLDVLTQSQQALVNGVGKTAAIKSSVAGIKAVLIAATAAGLIAVSVYTLFNNKKERVAEKGQVIMEETAVVSPIPQNTINDLQTVDVKPVISKNEVTEPRAPQASKRHLIYKNKNNHQADIQVSKSKEIKEEIITPQPRAVENNNLESNPGGILLENKQPVNKVSENKQNQSQTEKPQQEEIYVKPEIPNVFTPNGDGVNDKFVITIEQDVVYDLKITDNNGKVVFETTDKNKHWDGINQSTGNKCESGIYIMVFRYQVLGMSKPEVKNGKIEIIK
jgi:gliding motility-associated-like protein